MTSTPPLAPGRRVIRSRPVVILFVTLCNVFLGCEASQSAPDRSSDYVFVRGELLHNSPAVGIPFEIRTSGRWLWISDAVGDPGLHQLDRYSGELVQSLGRQGEGPGDFSIGRGELLVRPDDDSGSIWTWDYRLARLTRFSPEEGAEAPVVVTIDRNPMRPDPPWRVGWLEPDLLVGVNPSEKTRFTLFRPSGELVRNVPGDFLGPEEVPIAQRRNSTIEGFSICPWPARGFAIIYFRVGRIEFYDRTARFVRLANIPFPSEPFIRDRGGSFRAVRGREYYRSCVVHADHLFAAFSGRRSADFEGPEGYASEYIHEFDWEGQLLQIYSLRPEIHAIDFGPEGRSFYGSSLTDASIYHFTLPPVH